MAAADVFVFPSLFEGSAVVTYEALACGLPSVVTPDAGSVVRDGVEGFVVPGRRRRMASAGPAWSRLGGDSRAPRRRWRVAARAAGRGVRLAALPRRRDRGACADDRAAERHDRHRQGGGSASWMLNYVYGTAAVIARPTSWSRS